MRYSIFLVLALTLTGWATCSWIREDDPILEVEIVQGKLKGTLGFSVRGRIFREFLGVPYAERPQRFQPPTELERWNGTRNATEFGSKCAQFQAPNYHLGSEDCLVLNVHTPNFESKTLLPVLVFFHGGSFQAGGFWESLGPENLMEHELIYVAVNYRLGALGFLSTGDGLVSGNNGLKDQVQALKFVQQNIKAFGGDPKRVAIMGESAGAAAVSYHLLSPLSKDLFSAAISTSGSALCPWAIARRPWETFSNLAAKVGCARSSTAESLQCLQSIAFQEITANQALTKWHYDPIAAFGPVVENATDGNSPFLVDSPFKLLTRGEISSKVPWIAGVVKDEGMLLHAAGILRNTTLTKELNDDWHRVAPLTFMYDELLSPEEQNATSAELRQAYFGKLNVSIETEENLSRLYSDRFFVYPVQRAAKLYAQHGAPTYLYLFSYAGEYTNVPEPPGNPRKIVTHGDDIQYLLHANFREDFPADSPSARFTWNYNNLWTVVAGTGEPNATWPGDTTWPPLPFNAPNANVTWYKFDSNASLVEEPFLERMQFWDSLPLTKAEEDA